MAMIFYLDLILILFGCVVGIGHIVNKKAGGHILPINQRRLAVIVSTKIFYYAAIAALVWWALYIFCWYVFTDGDWATYQGDILFVSSSRPNLMIALLIAGAVGALTLYEHPVIRASRDE